MLYQGELNPAISVKCSSADSSWKMQLLFLLLLLAVHSHLLPSSCTWCLFGLVVIQGNSDRKKEVLLRFFFSTSWFLELACLEVRQLLLLV